MIDLRGTHILKEIINELMFESVSLSHSPLCENELDQFGVMS